MDGNGRWATKQGKKRFAGHNRGAKTVSKIVEEAAKEKIEYLTLFAFSTENWNRPKEEVNILMKLLVSSLRREFTRLTKNNIKLSSIGNIDSLPRIVQEELSYVKNKTKNNTGMVLTLALNYGGKEEIIDAVKSISNKVKNSIISPEKVDEYTIFDNI